MLIYLVICRQDSWRFPRTGEARVPGRGLTARYTEVVGRIGIMMIHLYESMISPKINQGIIRTTQKKRPTDEVYIEIVRYLAVESRPLMYLIFFGKPSCRFQTECWPEKD